MGENSTKVYFQNLIAIAFVDGHIAEREMAFLKQKALIHNINEDDLNAWINSAHNLHFVIPPHIVIRHAYLDEYMDMVLADGIVHPNELVLLKKICSMIGLSEDDLYGVIDSRNLTIAHE